MAIVSPNIEIRAFPSVIKYVVLVIVALVLLSWLNPFVVINAGHRGVITTFGKVNPTVLEEGLHFRIPVMQQVREIKCANPKGRRRWRCGLARLAASAYQNRIELPLIPTRVVRDFSIGG